MESKDHNGSYGLQNAGMVLQYLLIVYRSNTYRE